MPLTKSALKTLRQEKRRTATNKPVRTRIKSTADAYRAKPSLDLLSAAFSALDRAAKNKVIHKNKAARLKSRLAKLMASK